MGVASYHEYRGGLPLESRLGASLAAVSLNGYNLFFITNHDPEDFGSRN